MMSPMYIITPSLRSYDVLYVSNDPSFRSYDVPYVSDKKLVYRGGYNHSLWESLRASTAAPSYFSEHEIGGDVHIDGALLYNNPTGKATCWRDWRCVY